MNRIEEGKYYSLEFGHTVFDDYMKYNVDKAETINRIEQQTSNNGGEPLRKSRRSRKSRKAHKSKKSGKKSRRNSRR